MKIPLLLILCSTFLSGCATNEEYIAQLRTQENIAVAKANAPSTPLFVMEAHEGQEIRLSGVKRLEINTPRSAQEQQTFVPAPPESPAWRAIERIMVTGISATAGVATTGLLVDGVKALGSEIKQAGVAGYPHIQGNTTTTTYSVGGDGVSGSGTSGKTTTTSTTTTEQSNNPVSTSTTTDNHSTQTTP